MPEHYDIVTTAQVEHTYRIEVEDGLSEEDGGKQATKRLRTYLTDPGSTREGIVTLVDEKTQTAQRRVGKATKVKAEKAEKAEKMKTQPTKGTPSAGGDVGQG